MAYSPYDRSELELRFEKLFQELFLCFVEDMLTPQYPLQVEDRYYRIDYAFITDKERIAIELDGHGKIRNAANSSKAMNDLFTRQNDIMQAGFKVYRFTWDDVVNKGGEKARKRLLQIFRGKQGKNTRRGTAKTESLLPVERQEEQPPYNSNNDYHPTTCTTASIVDGAIVDTKKPFKWAMLFLACLVMGLGVMAWTDPKADPTPATTPPVVTQSIQPLASQIERKKEPYLKQQLVVPKPTYAKIPSLKRKPVTVHKPEPMAADNTSLPVQEPTPSPPTPAEAPAEETPVSVDEIVVFNQRRLIYHKPHCYWAKKCTSNCVYIPKSKAINLGGRPAESCYPQ